MNITYGLPLECLDMFDLLQPSPLLVDAFLAASSARQ